MMGWSMIYKQKQGLALIGIAQAAIIFIANTTH
jgi:hypothetical protein